MQLTDSHAHIDFPQFDADRDAMLTRAQAAGVTTLLAIGTGPGPEKLDAALPYAEAKDWIYTTVGIHPHEAKEVTPAHLDTLARLAQHPKVIAWGEIGLDYFYDHSPRDLQERVFRQQMELAHAAKLPIVTRTGNAQDVSDALDAKVDGIEHGSLRDRIPEATFTKMKAMGVTFDPTLSVMEAMQAYVAGKTDLLDRSLVQQVVPRQFLGQVKDSLNSPGAQAARQGIGAYPFRLDLAKLNLAAAHRSGVTLVTGTDAGNPMVVHGPGVHRELQLWVEAGIPPAAALQGATYNAARLLRADQRIGLIRKGYDASLLLVDGNPLQDISATERISTVFFKGERVDRAGLFEQK